MKNKVTEPYSMNVREKAVEMLRNKPSGITSGISDFRILKLINELEVHQLELELQNKELEFSKERSEIAVEKYTQLYDFAPVGYFTLSSESTIIELNLRGAEMLGKEHHRLINSQFGFFVSEDTRPTFNQFLEKVINGKDKESCKLTLISDRKMPFYVQINGVVTEVGKKCLVTMVDITDFKQVEDVLRESEKKLRTASLYERSLIEASLDPLVTISIEGKITDVNRATENVTGLSRNELIGTDFSDYFTEPDRSKAGYQNVFDNGFVVDYPLTIRHSSGKLTDVLYNACIFRDEQGKILGVFAAARDITERKKAEQEIKRKNDELEQLNCEKDKFFSIVAHDLRSPFNGLLGFSNLLVDELENMTLDETRKVAESMKSSASNLFHLLENLLEWSRMQRGITHFNPGVFVLKPIISESLQPGLDSADKKGIATFLNIPEKLDVFADQYMLASTIRNLASNAVKFTPKGGKVFISAKTVNGNAVEISVKDTGIGMSPEMINDLFRMDVLSSRRGTEGEPSSGLGLTLCKDFIEKHGGEIRVESETNKGSTFYIILPAAPLLNG